jgi:hypothetical protein
VSTRQATDRCLCGEPTVAVTVVGLQARQSHLGVERISRCAAGCGVEVVAGGSACGGARGRELSRAQPSSTAYVLGEPCSGAM